VLSQLGVNLDISFSDVEKCIETVGIGFLFSPLSQGPMSKVAHVREEMGIRTIFNLIAPLANPAGATRHVLGVYGTSLTEKLARVLLKLGETEAFVVCGEDTFDEISLSGSTRISRLKDGEIESFDIEPENFGLERADRKSLRGGSAQKNAQIITEVLDGKAGPRRDVVLLNASAAFVVAGLDSRFEDGILRAASVIDSGKARQKLDELIDCTGQCSSFFRKDI
jgi:anthranilate phosphoribosyltransferase